MENLFFYTDDCSDSYVTTPNSTLEYVDRISGNVLETTSNIRNYNIKFSTNCCIETSVLVPVRYPFNIDVTDCVNFGVDPGINVTMVLSGILSSFVTKVESSYLGLVYDNVIYTSVLPDNTLQFSLVDTTILPNESRTIYYRISHVDGFQYILTVDYSIEDTYCPVVLSVINIEYPTLDSRIEITDISGEPSRLSLNTLFSSDTLLPGVYQVSITQNRYNSLNTIFRSHFIECSIRCDVIAKLVQCRTSDIIFYYDALRYSNDCSNITYTEKCAMYDLMYLKLVNQGCIDPYEDCDCNGTVSKSVTSFRLNNTASNHKKCGCG